MQLSKVILNVQSPAALAAFYRRHLGMGAVETDGGWVLGFDGAGTQLALRPATVATNYALNDADRYWKLGVTLPNVDIAYDQLRSTGVAVTTPRQFRDIGYLCHLTDPEGFQVELLQHTFSGNRPAGAGNSVQALGGGAQIGQVTLRVTDIDAALAKYCDQLGMRLLSIQAVPEFGFTLYFLAFTAERPPVDELESVANREWLWQRPYTMLELQHVPGRSLRSTTRDGRAGFAGIIVRDSNGERLIDAT